MQGDRQAVAKIGELVYELRVGDVMHRDVITVRPDQRMTELHDILKDNKISGMPVAEGKKLEGVISLEDFIRWLEAGSPDCPIAEKMTKDAASLYADEPLVHAIGRFDKLGFGRFPVLDRKSRDLVGVLTKGDIVEGLLNKLQIEYHEEEIHRYRASHFFEDIVADRTTLKFEYDIKGKDFDRAGEGSSGLKRTLRRLGLSPKLIRRVAVATYEAEMNVVIYAERGCITARIEPQSISVVIEDTGPGIPDVEEALREGFSTAPDWVRELGFGAGMGLPNIKRCCDDMTLESVPGKGTCLRMTIATGDGYAAA